MDNYIVDKVVIGVSACQYGCKVRYNGKGWDMIDNLKREKNEFTFYPVCPELLSSMGVPRMPISLKGGNGDAFWQGEASIKDRNGKKLDEQVKKGCNTAMDLLKSMDIDVFIFMEGSPSCGVYRTSLKGKRIGNPPGVFGSLLLKEDIFLIPAVDLQSPIKWWDWRRRMYAYVWLKKQEIKGMGDLYDAWHIVKFLCQEIFRKKSDELGHKIANFKNPTLEEIDTVKTEMLNMLRHPSDIKKIKQSLWKNYKYLEKKKAIEIDEVMHPTDIRNMSHIANELCKVEVVSKNSNLLFGASPIYRKR